MSAYYNEWEAYSAQWLRNLAAASRITPGFVDERSITDVLPASLDGFARVHLFAGIGGWEEALRIAGWPADLPVWTGSCPCQPFSTAGKGKGINDERHLWPEMLRLISECRPPVVFGEQVASAAGRAWLSAVRADLEALGYAVGAADLCAAGVGAPHIRQRLWWVAWLADSSDLRCNRGRGAEAAALQGECAERGGEHAEPGIEGIVSGGLEGLRGDGGLRGALNTAGGGLGHPASERRDGGEDSAGAGGGNGAQVASDPWRNPQWLPCADGEGVVNAEGAGLLRTEQPQDNRGGLLGGGAVDVEQGGERQPGVISSPWSNPEWLPCSDGKARPTQPGIFPLAHGVPGRVGQLRASGNAIVPQVAAAFIAAFMEVQGITPS